MIDCFTAPVVEPVRRNKDGMRWIVHRFPIKGGISLRDTWMRGQAPVVTEVNGAPSFRGISIRIKAPR